MVIIQYEATLDVKKLATSIRKLRPVAERLDESQFDLRPAIIGVTDCGVGSSVVLSMLRDSIMHRSCCSDFINSSMVDAVPTPKCRIRAFCDW